MPVVTAMSFACSLPWITLFNLRKASRPRPRKHALRDFVDKCLRECRRASVQRSGNVTRTGTSSLVSRAVATCGLEKGLSGVRRLTRIVLLRGMGLVYLAAFATSAMQSRALFGSHGLVPLRQPPSRPTPAFSALEALGLGTFSDWQVRLCHSRHSQRTQRLGTLGTHSVAGGNGARSTVVVCAGGRADRRRSLLGTCLIAQCAQLELVSWSGVLLALCMVRQERHTPAPYYPYPPPGLSTHTPIASADVPDIH